MDLEINMRRIGWCGEGLADLFAFASPVSAFLNALSLKAWRMTAFTLGVYAFSSLIFSFVLEQRKRECVLPSKDALTMRTKTSDDWIRKRVGGVSEGLRQV
jgi:hypothetical protein